MENTFALFGSFFGFDGGFCIVVNVFRGATFALWWRISYHGEQPLLCSGQFFGNMEQLSYCGEEFGILAGIRCTTGSNFCITGNIYFGTGIAPQRTTFVLWGTSFVYYREDVCIGWELCCRGQLFYHGEQFLYYRVEL